MDKYLEKMQFMHLFLVEKIIQRMIMTKWYALYMINMFNKYYIFMNILL